MKNKDEIIKKAQLIKKQNEELQIAARDKAIELENLAKQTILIENADQKTDKTEHTSYFMPKPEKGKSDWEKILAEFKEKYPNTPVDANVLTFATKEEAINFFKSEATKGHKFLAEEITQEGTPTGFYLFSCGDKNMYQGTISQIHDQLLEAQLKNPDDANLKEGIAKISALLNPTQSYRESMRGERPSDGNNTSPTPLGTNPLKK